MINEETKNQAYVVGRLFSVFEQLQEEANSGISTNATIKNKYFNQTCETPQKTIPLIYNVVTECFTKLKKERKIYFEKQIGELMDKLDNFPERLSLEEQNNFMLGYYHQTQKRYKK